LNCVEACPHGSLEFRFFRKKAEVTGTSLSRRKTLAAAVAGFAMVPLLRGQAKLGKGRNERPIRPPGALDETDFLARCIRCGECIRVCPNDALHPAITEAGLEGLWSPLVTPRIGYCEPSCVLCSEVCPTRAILELTPQRKSWEAGDNEASPPMRIGTAVYDRGNCLPWAKATECVVCLEWCPVAPKAIYVQAVEAVDAEGRAFALKQPHIDTSRCVGCGACEFSCPLQDQPGVYVTSMGESRSRLI
jgi:ferredoxin